jgi:hypothetical protein
VPNGVEVFMYTNLINHLQRALILSYCIVDDKSLSILDNKRIAFRSLFELYCTLESFNGHLKKAYNELDALANGGLVVRTVVQHKLEQVRNYANQLGGRLCKLLLILNPPDAINIDHGEKNDLVLRQAGIYHIYSSLPLKGIVKRSGLGHCYEELSPYIIKENNRITFELAFTKSEPILEAKKIYHGIGYEIQFEAIEREVKQNIQNQLSIERIDIRATEQFKKHLQFQKADMLKMEKSQQLLANMIKERFTLDELLGNI